MYRKRIIETLIERKLAGKSAILIEGPKWCGKTTTAKQFSNSILALENLTTFKESLQMFELSPSTLMQGKVPRLIDEWQLLPGIWDLVCNETDEREEPSQFIMTGSTMLSDPSETGQSGTGRISHIKMRPMSLYESGESTGAVSIGDIFEAKPFSIYDNTIELDELAYLTCRGGWPWAVSIKNRKNALDQAVDYLDSVIQNDLNRIDKVRRNPRRAKMLMRAYARNISGQVSCATLRKDMTANDSGTLDEDTVADYIKAFKKIYLIEDLPAWSPNLINKSVVRIGDTRHFVDPSIGTSALGYGPSKLIKNLELFNRLFKDLAIRDLRIYAESIDAELYHYKDSSGTACDAVIQRRNGEYGLIEIVLGGAGSIEEAATRLKKVASNIDTKTMPEPSFMAVVIGVGKYALRRQDRIYVIPVGCMKN